mmetsp:Transcript_19397/g.23179  ORF Transcript_19397/g.23179 Transcript_19397/m.23179 type:complete len:600 (-) Transcript_19397:668-2467(-)|eukprot:CAMPEP_0197851454 /NCGR_PEP_ID=MMETSP1438-20131217/18121_1 /TAXON_ID=1461541 /ORGANISM="Pterosperma sp., Strain CCMP1384" /LENGTH=599 /DNA_ID=CAMNT_0043465061 /DNA_START=206 /DNA_END=2005 /DNA_ORIENTATION=-
MPSVSNAITLGVALSMVGSSTALSEFKANWGSPFGGTREMFYQTDIKDVQSHCRLREDLASAKETHPTLIVQHFNDTKEYNVFVGNDITPWNHHLYPYHSGWRKTVPLDTGLKHSTCKFKADDKTGGNGEWSVRRIGPLTSHGGYDWWQFASKDVFNLQDAIDEHGQIYLVDSYIAGVLEDGTVLEHPPIHVHHIHVVPPKEYLRYQWPFTGEEEMQKNFRDRLHSNWVPYMPNYFIDRHGEWDMCGYDKSGKCYTEQLPPGYGFLVDEAPDFEGEVNDVRATDSEPLVWYFEIGVRYVPVKGNNLKPASMLVSLEAHALIQSGQQFTYENYYFVPTAYNGITWYESIMPVDGTLLRIKSHNHMTLMNSTYLFDASAEELGLLNPEWPPLRPDGIKTRAPVLDIGKMNFQNFDELMDYLMENLKKHGKDESHLKCRINTNMVEVDGFQFAQYPHDECKFWNLRKGAKYTSVAFQQYIPGTDGGPGPHKPLASTGGKVAEALPMHNQWFLIYDSNDYTSHYDVKTADESFYDAKILGMMMAYIQKVHRGVYELHKQTTAEATMSAVWNYAIPATVAVLTYLFTAWFRVTFFGQPKNGRAF